MRPIVLGGGVKNPPACLTATVITGGFQPLRLKWKPRLSTFTYMVHLDTTADCSTHFLVQQPLNIAVYYFQTLLTFSIVAKVVALINHYITSASLNLIQGPILNKDITLTSSFRNIYYALLYFANNYLR